MILYNYFHSIYNIDKFHLLNKKIRLQIWDTAGQERFRNITKSYFQSSHGFVLLYDITDKVSFEKLNFWIDQLKLNGPKDSKFILVGINVI